MNNNNSTTQITLKCRTCQIVPDHQWLLHHVNLNNNHSRLCTSCVLKSNIGLFCPTCFTLIDVSSRPYDDRLHVICRQCKSRSHRGCVVPTASQNTNFYTCPPCSSANYTFFDVKRRNGDGDNNNDKVVNVIDKKGANAFLSAAKIAMTSMSKAAVLAGKEAEKKAKEALFCREKAREALQRLDVLAARERAQLMDAALRSPWRSFKSSNAP